MSIVAKRLQIEEEILGSFFVAPSGEIRRNGSKAKSERPPIENDLEAQARHLLFEEEDKEEDMREEGQGKQISFDQRR